MPSRAIIQGYKGVLDFYEYKGLACVRSWPYHSPRVPWALEAANQASFAYINKLWSSIAPFVQDLYRAMAVGTPFTGKDLCVKAYMNGLAFNSE